MTMDTQSENNLEQPDGITDPSDIFSMNHQQREGLMRVMLGAGETIEESSAKTRLSPEDILQLLSMYRENEWVRAKGEIDEGDIMHLELILKMSEHGASRHEVVQMYTKIMSPHAPYSPTNAKALIRSRMKENPPRGAEG